MVRALTMLTLLLAGPAAGADGDTTALGLYPVRVDGRAGFMDRAGQVVIPAIYDEVSAFSEGLARVKVGVTRSSSGALTGGTYGYIDRTGKVVIAPRFEYARDFHDGRAAAREGRERVYIDKAGEVVIRGPTGRTEDFSERLAAVEVRRDRWAFLKPDGSVAFALPPDTDMSDPARFHEGHAAVDFRRGESDRGTRYYDRIGKVVLEIPHRTARNVAEGMMAVRDTATERWGFMDLKGEWVLKPTWRFAWGFKDGRAQVTTEDGRVQFVDKAGAVLFTAPEGVSVDYPSEGLMRFEKGKLYGYMDLTGEVVIPATWKTPYSHLERFHGGLALVAAEIDGEHHEGYVDTAGKVVWKPTPTAWRPAPK